MQERLAIIYTVLSKHRWREEELTYDWSHCLKKRFNFIFSSIRLDRPRPLCLLTKRLSFNSLNRIWIRKSRVAENTLDLRSDIGIFSHQCLSLFTFFISHSAISNCGHCYGLGLCLYFIYLNHHLRSNFRTLSFLAIHFYLGFVAPPHNIWNDCHCLS